MEEPIEGRMEQYVLQERMDQYVLQEPVVQQEAVVQQGPVVQFVFPGPSSTAPTVSETFTQPHIIVPEGVPPPGYVNRGSQCPELNLKAHLDVYGNKFRSMHFIAVRFKNPVIIQHNFGVTNNAIRLKEGYCIAVNADQPGVIHNKHTNGGIVFHVKDLHSYKKDLELELLKDLFPRQNFVFSVFYNRTLYVIAYHNPFKSFWTLCRKGIAFRALNRLYDSCVAKVMHFTMHEAALMRHFNRNSHGRLDKFSYWYPLAYHMSCDLTNILFFRNPSTDFGQKLYKIDKRSKAHVVWSTHPPEEFYMCQVTLSDTEPVGIACRFVNSRVEYVSVMIVSYTKEWYLDTNNMSCCFSHQSDREAMCRIWVPLLKDKTTWESFGFHWYMGDYLNNLVTVTRILNWLCFQTAEPYVHMFTDLRQVFQILLGSWSTLYDPPNR